MKIVFLGCGYLGYNLSEALKGKYETEVWGLVSPYSSFSTIFREINVFDFEQLGKQDLKDVIIIDTVSLVANTAKSDNENEFLRNLFNRYNDLFAFLKEKGIHSYYFVSSGGTVYGESDVPIKENHELLPKSLYAKSKVMLEKSIEESGLNYIIMRLSNPYGGYQVTDKKQGVIPILIEKVLKNEQFELWGESTTVRDYIYIDDLSKIMNVLIDKDTKNEVINIGSGIGHSLQDVFDLVESKTKKNIDLKKIQIDVPVVKSIILDISKLKSLTGITSNTSLEEGIEKEVRRIQEELK
ncbi:NAD-dependent epimerase/dehydratase family protein [Anaerorhabdus sp.]|uniref:NAD-dependent epimerase/dehydratase family protein n=1 Tax=Anaerorhabdus sp. TaxID=1872524 RepID=UPI002FCA52B5